MAERSHPTSKVRGRSREDPMPEEQRLGGATWSPRSGAVAGRSFPTPSRPRPEAAAGRTNPTSKERWLPGRRRA